MPSLQYLGKCPHDISRTLAELRSTKEVFSTTFFYMKVFDLSAVLGEEVPYIVALQTALPDGKADLAELARHTKILDQNMHKVKVALASIFFVATSMTRDDAGVELNDGYKETYLP